MICNNRFTCNRVWTTGFRRLEQKDVPILIRISSKIKNIKIWDIPMPKTFGKKKVK